MASSQAFNVPNNTSDVQDLFFNRNKRDMRIEFTQPPHAMPPELLWPDGLHIIVLRDTNTWKAEVVINGVKVSVNVNGAFSARRLCALSQHSKKSSGSRLHQLHAAPPRTFSFCISAPFATQLMSVRKRTTSTFRSGNPLFRGGET